VSLYPVYAGEARQTPSGQKEGLDIHATSSRVTDHGQLTTALATFLKARLPDYMIPASFMILDSLPLTPNGKIDRKALPAPEFQPSTGFSQPNTPTEALLAVLWANVLKREAVGRNDHFFELGGHSLLATQLVSRIRESFRVELPIRAIFEHPQLARLATAIDSANKTLVLPAIEIQAEDAAKVLSFAQQRLWFLNQFEGQGNATYNMPAALRLSGQLNSEALQQSLMWLMERHTSLRTCFPPQDGEATPAVRPMAGIEALAVVDLSALAPEEQRTEVQRLANAHAMAPFDLGQGPLFKAGLLLLDDNNSVLLLNMHHIISDGWSLGVMLRDWQHAYTAFALGNEPGLPPLAIQYSDYAAWQRQWFLGEVLDAQVAYWAKQLDGLPGLLELPTDKPRPPQQSYRGAHFNQCLPSALSQAVSTLSRQHGVTVFMALLAAFNLLLSRYSRSLDICVGSPIANRTHSHTEDLIGFFVNTLVLRSQLEPEQSFIELLHATRQTCLEAYAHQDLPFEMLVDTLKPTRSMSHSPLFQVMFVLQNNETAELALPGLAVGFLETEYPVAKFDLTLSIAEQGGQFHCSWEYATDLFEAETVERMAAHFEALLDALTSNPQQAIGSVPMLTEGEIQQLQAWNDTATDYPKDQTLVDLFEVQVEATPDNIAVVFEDDSLTYRQLNAKANRLAHYLLSLAKPDGQPLLSGNPLIAIAVERSIEMVVGLLAILKAGGAYVPIDPSYPAARIRYMLGDSQAPLLLTQSHLTEALALADLEHDCVVLCLDQTDVAGQPSENLSTRSTAEDLAYVIYTSGTTGNSKGCQVTQLNVTRLFAVTEDYYHFNDRDVWTLFHSYAFDFSVWEIWGALIYGGCLVIVPYFTSRSPEDFYQLLIEQKVTVLNQTPSAFKQLINVDTQANDLSLRLVIFGGEALDFASLQPWFDHHGDQQPQLVNMYGITETTVHVTFYPITREQTLFSSVIGKPLPDLNVWLVDANWQPVPIGIPGEILVGGGGVARGYLNRPELTAEKFVEIELFGKTERVYKTGDLARWLPDGNLEFLGRIDHQIKLRGFRIELGEIEAVLTHHEGIKEAVVSLYEADGNQRLVAYIVVNGQWTESSDPCSVASDQKEGLDIHAASSRVTDHGQLSTALATFLKSRLPDYMIPASFMILDSLPLTPNGKIDRKALPAPEFQAANRYEAPRNDTEQQLARIWCQLLKLDSIGIHENFFELGGDSILSIQAVARARQSGLQLTPKDLFEHQTIAQLARVVGFGVATDAEQGLADIPHPLSQLFDFLILIFP